MRLSIFTPTHNTQFLGDAYASLKTQSFENWEWVLVPNGSSAVIPADVAADSRVKVRPAPELLSGQGVGVLKRFACEVASGDYFIELDHDDMLVPDALVEIAAAASVTGAGFMYSDFANFYADGKPHIYNTTYGWTHYPLEAYGKRYTAMRAFPPSPESLHSILFSPNHVRVWSREAYQLAGGHDPSFPVADDHDLISRTYLTGKPFHHIPKCLYLYREHEGGANTYLKHNAEIMRRSEAVGARDQMGVIRMWCEHNRLTMLDLSSTGERAPDFQSVARNNADINCDVRFGLPLPDNSVGCLRAFDFLSRLNRCPTMACTHGANGHGPRCIVGVLNEFYRVLAPGGWLMTGTVSSDGRGAFQDPTHQSFWNPNSFWYYTRREQASFVPGMTSRFYAHRVWQTFPNDWHREHDIPMVYANLVALKGQPLAGLAEI